MESKHRSEIVFFETIGSVIDLHEFGSIIDVPRDNNCGYYSFLLGLIYIGRNDIKSITGLRFSLH